MRYTVWSRGRLVGETELGFVQIDERSRAGWFVPTEEGERIVAGIATPLLSTMAGFQRQGSAGESAGVTALADLAEVEQHAAALELELRREDGSVVPTEHIGFQDMERLLALGRMVAECEIPEWEPPDEPPGDLDDERLQADIEHDLALIEEWFGEKDGEWEPEEPIELGRERYQVFVLLGPERQQT